MRESGEQPDAFFHRLRYGRNAEGELASALEGYTPVEEPQPYWDEEPVCSLVVDEVESIWSSIDQHDDWQPLHNKIEAIRTLGNALGEPPVPAGHLRMTG